MRGAQSRTTGVWRGPDMLKVRVWSVIRLAKRRVKVEVHSAARLCCCILPPNSREPYRDRSDLGCQLKPYLKTQVRLMSAFGIFV